MKKSKVCNTCKIRKPLERFYKSKKHSDGRKGKCDTCTQAWFFKRRHKDKLPVQDLEGEIWKSIDGYNGAYMVSNKKRVKSLNRTVVNSKGVTYFLHSKIMKVHINMNGYLIVYLSENGKDRTTLVHQLVARAFIPNPFNKKEVNHKFGDKTDCLPESLEWVTGSENMKHAFRTGLISNKGADHPQAKFTNDQVREIREKIKTGQFTHKQIAEVYGVSKSTIAAIGNRQNWNYD